MATNYRKKCFSEKGKECVSCGAAEDIEVHHIDRDRSNNDVENLQPLCADCHNDEHREERVERMTGATVGYRGSGIRPESNGPDQQSAGVRDVDWQIIEILREGRNNAPNIAERLGYSRQYIAERLGFLKSGNVVEPIGHGIYELEPEEVPENGG